MRIIAGDWRGRRLAAPPGDVTRPTADRTRETLFSMLASRLGTFEDFGEGRYRSMSYDAAEDLSEVDVSGGPDRGFVAVRSLLRGLVRLLVDKEVINVEELSTSVKACDASDDLDFPKGP